MSKIEQDSWVAHEGYNGIWQVAEIKTKGGIRYAALHNHLRPRTEGGKSVFYAVKSGPRSITSSVDVLTVADEFPTFPIDTSERQSFPEKQKVWQGTFFWVESPSLPTSLAPIIFTPKAYEKLTLDAGDKERVIEEFFGEHNVQGASLDNRKRKYYTINIKDSRFIPVPGDKEWQLVREQMRAMFGTTKVDKIMDSNPDIRDWSNVLRRMRAINRIDGIDMTKDSFDEAMDIQAAIDGGYFRSDLAALLRDDPTDGLRVYDRFRKIMPYAISDMIDELAEKVRKQKQPAAPPAAQLQAQLRLTGTALKYESDPAKVAALQAQERLLKTAIKFS